MPRQFGVYTGGTLRGIVEGVKGFGHLWGFDSFTGLPAESPGLKVQGKHWRAGGFSAADTMNEHKLESLVAKILRSVPYNNVTLLPGFFSRTLVPSLLQVHAFQPALLIDVDVDLHISSMQALEWMLQSRLLRVGTLVRYDDWVSVGHGEREWGEPLTHSMLTSKYNLTWRTIGGLPGAREFKLLRCGACVQYHHE